MVWARSNWKVKSDFDITSEEKARHTTEREKKSNEAGTTCDTRRTMAIQTRRSGRFSILWWAEDLHYET